MLNLLASLTFFPFSLFISYSHNYRLVLHVQEEWGNCRSFYSIARLSVSYGILFSVFLG
jgi:hypothetical protein